VSEVTHERGTDRFIVRHTGPLAEAARAVDRKVMLRGARRGLERLARVWRRDHPPPGGA